MIQVLLQQDISKAINELYSLNTESKDIVLQPTKKEFEGDYTLVVFPYVKLAKKSPEQLAEDIAKKTMEHSSIITGYKIIKCFINFFFDKSYLNKILYKKKFKKKI